MSNKITKRDRFNALLNMAEVQNDPGMVEFIEHELELLNRKNSAERKPTAQQIANMALADAICAQLSPAERYTVSEAMKIVPECAELSNQKVSRIMGDLVKAGRMERIEDKRKTYFQLR